MLLPNSVKTNSIWTGLPIACISLILFTGCETRSISDSGYRGNYYYSGNSIYRGELSEFDVLGIERNEAVTEADIANALQNTSRVKLKRGGSILLIQSGAAFPDEPMIEELSKVFTVTPFSGQPVKTDLDAKNANQTSYSKSIRLAAAKGGHESIVCCWGILEPVINFSERAIGA